MKENGVNDNAVFRPFNLIHFTSLFGNRHILMNNTDTAFTSNGNRHRGFRYGIHSGTHNRHVQLNISCQISRNIDVFRQYIGFCRYQQHVIECQALHTEFISSHIRTSILTKYNKRGISPSTALPLIIADKHLSVYTIELIV